MMPLCSSEISSSRSEHSMAWDSTPRMLAGAKTVPVAGMVTPGSAMMALMPARALGAPQTTCFTPSRVSTTQRRSLSALGCFSACVTWATVKASRCEAVADLFDFEADADEPLADLVERGGGVEMILQPGEGEFHDSPPASVGTCSARNP